MLSDRKNGPVKNPPISIVLAFNSDAYDHTHGYIHDRDHDRDRQVNLGQANLACYPPWKNQRFCFHGD